MRPQHRFLKPFVLLFIFGGCASSFNRTAACLEETSQTGIARQDTVLTRPSGPPSNCPFENAFTFSISAGVLSEMRYHVEDFLYAKKLLIIQNELRADSLQATITTEYSKVDDRIKPQKNRLFELALRVILTKESQRVKVEVQRSCGAARIRDPEWTCELDQYLFGQLRNYLTALQAEMRAHLTKGKKP